MDEPKFFVSKNAWEMLESLMNSNSIGFPKDYPFPEEDFKTAHEVTACEKLFKEEQQFLSDLLVEEMSFLHLLGAAKNGLPCLHGTAQKNVQVFDTMTADGKKLNLLTECYE